LRRSIGLANRPDTLVRLTLRKFVRDRARLARTGRRPADQTERTELMTNS
jgi:hypothetical protein